MNEIYYLNLPPLPADVTAELLALADTVRDDISGRDWIEKFHSQQVRAASHVYNQIDVPEQVRELYSPYFKCEFLTALGVLKNSYGTGYVESPPHCDRFRQTAINILLRTGGDNVQTCFYTNKRQSTDLSTAENCTRDTLTLDKKFQTPAMTWYAFDVQQYHSVENIESTRVLFSLVLVDNPDINTFKTTYPNLIIN